MNFLKNNLNYSELLFNKRTPRKIENLFFFYVRYSPHQKSLSLAKCNFGRKMFIINCIYYKLNPPIKMSDLRILSLLFTTGILLFVHAVDTKNMNKVEINKGDQGHQAGQAARYSLNLFSNPTCSSSGLFTFLMDSACYSLGNASSIRVQCNAEGNGGILYFSYLLDNCLPSLYSIPESFLLSFRNDECISLSNNELMNNNYGSNDGMVVVGTKFRGNNGNSKTKFTISAPSWSSSSSSWKDSWKDNKAWSYPKYSSYLPYPSLPFDDLSWKDIDDNDYNDLLWSTTGNEYPPLSSGSDHPYYTNNPYSSSPTSTVKPKNVNNQKIIPLAISLHCLPVYGPKKIPYAVPSTNPYDPYKADPTYSVNPNPSSSTNPYAYASPTAGPETVPSSSSTVSALPTTAPSSPVTVPSMVPSPLISIVPFDSNIPNEVLPSSGPEEHVSPSAPAPSTDLSSTSSSTVVVQTEQPTSIPPPPIILDLPSSLFMARPDDFSVTWYGEENCDNTINPLDYSVVVGSVGFCQAVPDAPIDANGYRVYCEHDEIGQPTGYGIFEVCGNYPQCSNCTVHSPFTENPSMCMVNDKLSYGATSMEFRCRNIRLPPTPPQRGRANLVWFGLPNCEPTFRTLVDVQQNTCNRVPRGINAGYRVTCDPLTQEGIFQICKDGDCTVCDEPIIVPRDVCMPNPPEYGSSSFVIQCPVNIDPEDFNFNIRSNATPVLVVVPPTNDNNNNVSTNHGNSLTLSSFTVMPLLVIVAYFTV